MRAVLIDLACGILFVALAFFGARVLLAGPRLVYLCFPLPAIAAWAVGYWRGAAGTRSLLLIAIVATLPLLILALYFFSGRNKPLIAFPIVRSRSFAWA